MKYYNVTFVGLYFNLTAQVSFDECNSEEDVAIAVADDRMREVYGWQVQDCSHEVIVEVAND